MSPCVKSEAWVPALQPWAEAPAVRVQLAGLRFGLEVQHARFRLVHLVLDEGHQI